MAEFVCPSCNQQNAGNMAFCIWCGSSLKPGNPSGRRPRIALGACPSCGKSDVLNSQYCINCGSAMSPTRNSIPRLPSADAPSSSQMPALAAPPKRGQTTPGVVLLVAALGLAAGGLGAYFIQESSQLTTQEHQTSGLLVYTAKPYVDFTLQTEDRKSYIVGRADSDGTLRFPDVPPGRYNLILGNGAYARQVSILPDRPATVGTPSERLLR